MSTRRGLPRRAALWALPTFVGLLGGLGLVAAACSSRSGGDASGNTSPPGSEDAAGGPAAADGGDAGDAADDAAPTPPRTYLRVAQLSPDLPAIDLCVAPRGTTTFQGPLIGQLAAGLAGEAGTDAAAPGLAYAQVSAYVPLAPGQYDVRLVAAGATSCSPLAALLRPFELDSGEPDADVADGEADDATVLDAGTMDATADAEGAADAGADASSGVSDTTDLPALSFNTYATLVIAGDFEPAGNDAPLVVTAIQDDAVLAGAAAVLRAVNAVPSAPSLDFGLESTAQWVPLLVDVAFGKASAQAATSDGTVDANGYLPIAPLAAGQELTARASLDAAADFAVASSVEIDLSAIATVIAIGGKTGDSAHPPALLVCIDNQPSGGLLSDCSVAQP